MRSLKLTLLALLVMVYVAGCDSTEEDPSDAELLVGTWTMVKLEDAERDKTADFATVANSLKATLNANLTYLLAVDYKNELGLTDVNIPGSYSVNEGAKTLILVAPTPSGGELQLPFAYTFESDSRVRLSIASDFVNALFGTTTYQGTVRLTIEK